ncbi:MAG: hypothetical protein AB2A00_34620 [Myxococcota bacterium]
MKVSDSERAYMARIAAAEARFQAEDQERWSRMTTWERLVASVDMGLRWGATLRRDDDHPERFHELARRRGLYQPGATTDHPEGTHRNPRGDEGQ